MLDTPSRLGGRTTISHDPTVHLAIDHQRSSDRRSRQSRSGGRNGSDSHTAWTKDWGQVSFTQKRWTTVQRIRPNDLLVCYLTGRSTYIGLLRVTGQPYFDETPIWASQ